MRRALQIGSLIAAAGLTGWGFRLLLKASRSEGWSAAAPSLCGLICLIIAACLIAPRIVGILAYPATALLDTLFYPGGRFTAPPDSLLINLRRQILNRQFTLVDRQLDALFKAYGPHPGLYHLRALLAAERGDDPRPITLEARRVLNAGAFEDYRLLLHKFPATLLPKADSGDSPDSL